MRTARALLPALALLAAASAASAQTPAKDAVSPASEAKVGALSTSAPGTITLRGLNGETEVLTSAQLAALPHQTVTLSHEGKDTVYAGPTLSELLRDIGAPMGVKLHGQGVNDVVFVTAADQYRVVLTLAEVDPSFHKGAKVILADQADGKPLDPKEGPFRLVVDGDLKPARSARSVVEIDLKHLP